MSCTSAALSARRNWRRNRMLNRATRMPVTEVPMLAPITAKTAVSTRITPVAAMAMTMLVVNDEL